MRILIPICIALIAVNTVRTYHCGTYSEMRIERQTWTQQLKALRVNSK